MQLAITPTTLVKNMVRRWLWIGLFVAAAGLGTFLWSRAQESVFRADILLVYVPPPEEADGGGASGLSGGVASLLGGVTDSSGRPVAIATLKSRELLSGFIVRHKLQPLLFPKLWDAETGRWNVPASQLPNANEAAETFRSKHLNVRESADDGSITLVLDLPDRKRVAAIANDLVATADARLRVEAQAESRKNLQFLRAQFLAATNAELRASITRLMEVELHRLALTQTGTRYAFHVIDRAVEPRNRVWPRVGLFTAAALALALFAACAASALWDVWRHERSA